MLRTRERAGVPRDEEGARTRVDHAIPLGTRMVYGPRGTPPTQPGTSRMERVDALRARNGLPRALYMGSPEPFFSSSQPGFPSPDSFHSGGIRNPKGIQSFPRMSGIEILRNLSSFSRCVIFLAVSNVPRGLN